MKALIDCFKYLICLMRKFPNFLSIHCLYGLHSLNVEFLKFHPQPIKDQIRISTFRVEHELFFVLTVPNQTTAQSKRRV